MNFINILIKNYGKNNIDDIIYFLESNNIVTLEVTKGTIKNIKIDREKIHQLYNLRMMIVKYWDSPALLNLYKNN